MPAAPADNAAAREQVVALIESGELAVGLGESAIPLPPPLDATSALGEITVQRSADDLVVVFFDVRGINHYTGWVYSSTGALLADPLGHRTFTIEPLRERWFRINAG